MLLTDCKISEMDGYELNRQIRAIEAKAGQKRTILIGITANVTGETQDSCFSARMDDYLPKP